MIQWFYALTLAQKMELQIQANANQDHVKDELVRSSCQRLLPNDARQALAKVSNMPEQWNHRQSGEDAGTVYLQYKASSGRISATLASARQLLGSSLQSDLLPIQKLRYDAAVKRIDQQRIHLERLGGEVLSWWNSLADKALKAEILLQWAAIRNDVAQEDGYASRLD